jgi:hypothetical protein
MRDYLFFGSSLSDGLRRGHQGAVDAVQLINEAQFLASSDDEIVDHVKAQWSVQPLTLHEEAAQMNQCETNVDVSHDPNRIFFPEDRGPHYVPGTEVTIQIPYTGTNWLWQAQTSTSTSVYPVGTVLPSAGNKAGAVTLKITLAHDVPKERFKQAYDVDLAFGIRLVFDAPRNDKHFASGYVHCAATKIDPKSAF